MAIGLQTFDDTTRREDLTDVITNVSPSVTPLLSGLSMGPDAQNTLHEYLSDTYSAATHEAQVESAGFTVTDHTAATRLTNIVQNFMKNIQVSADEIKTRHAGNAGNALEYQIGKNMVEHAKNIELSLLRGSRASGSSGVPRQMAGIINSISTNATTRVSGSSLGETTYNDIMTLIKASTDDIADEVYVGTTLKRDISAFTGNANTQLVGQLADKRLVNTLDVYMSDFGEQKIFWHRNMGNAANAKEFLAIKNAMHALSWFDRTHVERLPAESADRMRAQILSKLTIENRGEATGAFVDGFTA